MGPHEGAGFSMSSALGLPVLLPLVSTRTSHPGRPLGWPPAPHSAPAAPSSQNSASWAQQVLCPPRLGSGHKTPGPRRLSRGSSRTRRGCYQMPAPGRGGQDPQVSSRVGSGSPAWARSRVLLSLCLGRGACVAGLRGRWSLHLRVLQAQTPALTHPDSPHSYSGSPAIHPHHPAPSSPCSRLD